MSVFSKSKWIWADCEEGPDQYTEYITDLPKAQGNTVLNLSSDNDYTLFINGSYVASNQYADFEHYKIYDTIDITAHLTKEVNSIKFIIYHCGVDTQRYKRARAGLIYEVISQNEVIAVSNESTLSCLSVTYASGRQKKVSSQLGFTFLYDSTKEGKESYIPSIAVYKECKFFPRPIKKLKVCQRQNILSVTEKARAHYLIDLGKEVVGLPTLDFHSSTEQKITVAYGESLDDGSVRKTIGDRSFYFEYIAKEGLNTFTEYMLRIAGRYIEVFASEPIQINYIGILPQIYELDELPYYTENELDKKIYSSCENTLRLCMMEHYVDTPWREQCLYAFDSRNQMLCGYYCFKDKNKDYARANLKLISQDRRSDNLLSICYPCGTELAIPSFSLYYVIAMKEYIDYTGDTTLAKECLYKMKAILNEFAANISKGLICTFNKANMWNFYDWSQYSDGWCSNYETDLIINSLFIIAQEAYNQVCDSLNESKMNEELINDVRQSAKKAFYNGKLFTLHKDASEHTELCNSLAILAGIASGKEAEIICDSIVANELCPSSLSMNIWKYEALMLTNKEKYKEWILKEIRTNYKKMLDAGSTTVWETVLGSVDFDNAGSLCHGWSAVPIYIYHKLGLIRREE